SSPPQSTVREPAGLHPSSSPASRRIESEVELQNVDARLAEEAEGAALYLRRDELPDLRLGEAARPRDPRHLKIGRRRRDVGVEAAARGRDEVDRHGRE